MSKPTAPCKNCAERHPHCHGECEKYKQYKEEAVRDKEAYYRSREYDEYRNKQIRKQKRGQY